MFSGDQLSKGHGNGDAVCKRDYPPKSSLIKSRALIKGQRQKRERSKSSQEDPQVKLTLRLMELNKVPKQCY